MLLRLRPGLAGCVFGALAVLTLAQYPAQPIPSAVGGAWAMPGRDPQRTAQATAMGPQRATTPRLVRKGFTGPALIGSDGILYGLQVSTPPKPDTYRVSALAPDGHLRWTAWASRPGWRVGDLGAPLVLAPDDTVYFAGGGCRISSTQMRDSIGTAGCLSAVGAGGHLRWHAVMFGLTKAMPQPLVRPDGSLVRATVGPGGAPSPAILNVTVYAPNGIPLRLGTNCSWAATALGAADRLYAVTYFRAPINGNCLAYGARAGHPGSSVVAFSTGGRPLWVAHLPMAPLPEDCSPWALTVDAQRGQIYAAAACNVHGRRAYSYVYALDTKGRPLWMKDTASAAWPALALDRASGDLWLATIGGVQRLSSTGVLRWQITWHTTAIPDSRETLILDGQGTTYTCSGDGLLRAVSPTGHVLWHYQFRVPRYGYMSPPSAVIGPDGALYVSSDSEPGIVAFAP